ncbi:MAG: Maf family nucleotide pyrophosphatase [Legionella sp.]|nr:Maf family nucleotide pyrophosphatase [Legionella sp.]
MSSFLKQQKPLILASGSLIRKKLLQSIGLEFEVIPSDCDEEAFKASHRSENYLDLGYTLAQHKALSVSKRYPNHFVIAADQLCVIDDILLDKPLNHDIAIQHLQLLSGKSHQQIACLCIAQGNKILWNYHDIATLTLRDLNVKSIEDYLLADKPYQSCGAYQYETLGKWLFEKVDGKEDTILGLPLLPLISALTELKAVIL